MIARESARLDKLLTGQENPSRIFAPTTEGLMRDLTARRVFLGLLTLLLVASGCASRQFYLSDNYVQMLAEPLPKATRPLAREVRYTWLFDASPRLVHHYTDKQTEQQVRAGSFTMPKPSRSGSELFQRKAEEARAAAAKATTAAARTTHRDNAVAYSHASEAALRTEMAFGQATAAAGVLDATVGLFAAWGQLADEYFRKQAARPSGLCWRTPARWGLTLRKEQFSISSSSPLPGPRKWKAIPSAT